MDSGFIDLHTFSKICQICGSQAHGKNYEAITCRACAAFFRRAKVTKLIKKCKNDNNCRFIKNGIFKCKYCRFQQCLKVGMSANGFQYDLDPILINEKAMVMSKKIPPSMSNFLGRPSFITLTAPHEAPKRTFIDMRPVLEKAMSILRQGSETPIHSEKRLKKLALGFGQLRQKAVVKDPRALEKIGHDEILLAWETDVLKLARWLTYLDDFQTFPEHLQFEILKGIWKVWTRLDCVAVLVSQLRKLYHEEEIQKFDEDKIVYDWDPRKVDMTWCSNRPLQELKFFIDVVKDIKYDSLTKAMFELAPTDEELSYMMCQGCFHYVGKRYQGEILVIAEKIQEKIADDLHKYYSEDVKQPNYANRLTNMMKINNQIQKNVVENHLKIELASVFDVFHADCSHPELFIDA